MNPYGGTRQERARLKVLQALQDLGATSEETAARTKDIDQVVGDLSGYAQPNTKVVQSLLRDGLVKIDLSTPMKLWLTPNGSTYLSSETQTVPEMPEEASKAIRRSMYQD